MPTPIEMWQNFLPYAFALSNRLCPSNFPIIIPEPAEIPLHTQVRSADFDQILIWCINSH